MIDAACYIPAFTLKKLSKRDATTKIKALSELAGIFAGKEGHTDEVRSAELSRSH
jgi:hypothetical protein